MSSNSRPVFLKDQIIKYFQRLGLSEEHRKYSIENESPEDTLQYLSLLQKLHLVAIPFENLTLHYSYHRQLSLHPEALFQKIIGDNNGRGGYCMENNCLFGILLHSLGFNLYSAGARVYGGGKWNGWSHMVNIVLIGNARYHVDVGFGANTPTQPLELEKSGRIYPSIKPGSMRLQWRNLDVNTNPDQRLWVYEHRIDDQSDFQQMYCFTELEFLPNDYELMSYFTSTNPKIWFTQQIVCKKEILGGPDNTELVGSVILGDSIKWRILGKKEREEQFGSEEDRLKALEDVFGIKFSTVEKEGIRGLPSEIKKQ
ncbi:arylamine N-acetyltransferase 1 [Delitschia confertaspora ATCC 74209]|uniref:Arylamine N-acetyltransferase 1 n=1 Tax=Delitschia confertaspora ATCC 74209 TaxID=1513339 RepID=A0A9P4JWU3_9PLEO|nr:arylamine N-acetyltransferase 1 [Delitschia confertaspora ATCC 74209]